MKNKKLSIEQKELLNTSIKEYWRIKKECFENDQWKTSISLETRERYTQLEEIISSLNPDFLEFSKVPKSFLDYL